MYDASSSAHRTLSPGLTRALRGFFYAAAAIALGASFAVFNESRRHAAAVSGDPGSLTRLADAEEVSAGLVGLFGLCSLVLAVLTVMWWYQAYQAVDRTGLTGRSWSAGWAMGGWFIPLANFVIPKLVLDEIDRASGAAGEGGLEWRSRPTLRSSTWWWGCFVAGSLVMAGGNFMVAAELDAGVIDPERYRTGLQLTSLGLALDVVAALCATASLRVLGERLARP